MTSRPASPRRRSVVTVALTLVVLGALVLASAALLPWAGAQATVGAGFGVRVGATGDVSFPVDAQAVRALPSVHLGAATDLSAVLAGSSSAAQLHQRWPQTVLLAGLVLGWVAGVLASAGLVRTPRVCLLASVAVTGLGSVALVVAALVQVLGLRQGPQNELGLSLHAGLGAYLGVAGAVAAALGGAGALLVSSSFPGHVPGRSGSGRRGDG